MSTCKQTSKETPKETPKKTPKETSKKIPEENSNKVTPSDKSSSYFPISTLPDWVTTTECSMHWEDELEYWTKLMEMEDN